MSGICKKLSVSEGAQKICEYLSDKFGLTESDFDTGVPHVVRPEYDDPYLDLSFPNGEIEAEEVYARAIEFAEAEENANRVMVDKSNYGEGFTFNSPLHSFLATEAGMKIPWLFDNLEDDERAEWIYPRILIKIDLLKGMAKMKGYEEGTPEYKKSLARKIFRFIRKAPKKGGMGIEFDEKAKSPQRDLMDVMDSHKATCVEFANLYIAVARQAGLDVRPIEVYTDEEGNFIDHLKVAVDLGKGNAVFFGLHDGEGLDPDEEWSYITMNDLLAHDYNARSMVDCPKYGSEGAIECKGEFLERALDFSPRHYMALRNTGFWHYEQGDLESALEYYLKSRDEYPDYPNTRYDLHKVYLELDKGVEAEKECEAYKTLTGEASCD